MTRFVLSLPAAKSAKHPAGKSHKPEAPMPLWAYVVVPLWLILLGGLLYLISEDC